MMRREIEVRADAGRVDVTFHGAVSFLDRISTVDAVVPAIIEEGLSGVLLDYTNAWVKESSVAAFEQLKARLCGERSLRGLGIALVNPPDFHAQPTEEVGADAGFAVRRFGSRSAAIAWLQQFRA